LWSKVTFRCISSPDNWEEKKNQLKLVLKRIKTLSFILSIASLHVVVREAQDNVDKLLKTKVRFPNSDVILKLFRGTLLTS